MFCAFCHKFPYSEYMQQLSTESTENGAEEFITFLISDSSFKTTSRSRYCTTGRECVYNAVLSVQLSRIRIKSSTRTLLKRIEEHLWPKMLGDHPDNVEWKFSTDSHLPTFVQHYPTLESDAQKPISLINPLLL